MYISMTGFGQAADARDWGRISLELSSVNHRYQEISVRLPREIASMESWFHGRLRGCFRRGKLNVRVEIIMAAPAASASINMDVLMNYYRAISDARDALGSEQGISMDALLGLPGVLDVSARESLGDEAEEILSNLIDAASENWNVMRLAEGAHLRAAVGAHLADVERGMSEIASGWQAARDAAFDAMKGRVAAALLAACVSPDESRFAQEAVILADRWDISEEIDRMASHIAKFRATGDACGSEGRKLDFIVQEMNREVNTINSKAQNAGIRWLAVEVKSAIERIREQIQNLE